jgi:hypothetical protein
VYVILWMMYKSSVFWDITLPDSCWFVAWIILQPWRWRPHVSPKRRFTFNGLNGVISQNVELTVTIAVRTSNPSRCHKFNW